MHQKQKYLVWFRFCSALLIWAGLPFMILGASSLFDGPGVSYDGLGGFVNFWAGFSFYIGLLLYFAVWVLSLKAGLRTNLKWPLILTVSAAVIGSAFVAKPALHRSWKNLCDQGKTRACYYVAVNLENGSKDQAEWFSKAILLNDPMSVEKALVVNSDNLKPQICKVYHDKCLDTREDKSLAKYCEIVAASCGLNPPQDANDLLLAARDNTLTIEFLREYKGDIKVKTPFGTTPLHYAAANGKKDLVLEYLKRGAAINLPRAQGLTPLMLASEAGHLDVVKLLIAKGANPRLKSNMNLTALDFAISGNKKKVVMYLILDQYIYE